MRSIPSALLGRSPTRRCSGGTLTGNARDLSDPARKIDYSTMEEGIYEVDVATLEPKVLFRDEQQQGAPKADLTYQHLKSFLSINRKR